MIVEWKDVVHLHFFLLLLSFSKFQDDRVEITKNEKEKEKKEKRNTASSDDGMQDDVEEKI